MTRRIVLVRFDYGALAMLEALARQFGRSAEDLRAECEQYFLDKAKAPKVEHQKPERAKSPAQVARDRFDPKPRVRR